MRLFRSELRRALHRRVTWALVGLALVGVVIAGVTAFTSTSELDVARAGMPGHESPAVMRQWWVAGRGDGLLLVAPSSWPWAASSAVPRFWAPSGGRAPSPPC